MNNNAALRWAIFVSLGGFVFGFDASVISGVVGFVIAEFSLSDWQTGVVVSAPTLGAVLASVVAGAASDQIGRRRVLRVIAFLYVLSAAVSGLAPSFEVLVAARFIGGLAFASLILAPSYIAEIAPAAVRGRMVSINQINIVLGFSAAYFANYFILGESQSGSAFAQSTGLDQYAWRWMLGLEALPAAAYFFFMLSAPESPRYLVLQGRLDDARTIMHKIAPAEQIDDLLKSIKDSSREATSKLGEKIRGMFRPEMRKVIIVGLIAGIAQQSCGINVVFFYAPTIFEQSGVGTNAAFAQATYIGIVNVVFTVLAMLLIDKLGRKPLMLAGLVGVAISMAIAAYGFHTAYYQLDSAAVATLSEEADLSGLSSLEGVRYESDLTFKAAVEEAVGRPALRANEATLIQSAVVMNSTVILIGIMGFVASFAFSLGPVMWVLFSEIFPNRLRGVCMAFMGVVNSSVSWFVQFIFPWELATLGSAGTFILFSVFAVVCLILLTWLMPETRGRSLEQLEQELVVR